MLALLSQVFVNLSKEDFPYNFNFDLDQSATCLFLTKDLKSHQMSAILFVSLKLT